MDEDFEHLLEVLLNPHATSCDTTFIHDTKATMHVLSPTQLESVVEGLYWYMQVIPMLTLIPSSKIVVVIETERRFAQEWLSRSWQYKRYHSSNTSQLPLEDDQITQNHTLSSNESSFDMYWNAILSYCSIMKIPSLAMFDVMFYLLVTFAVSTGNFSDPNALRMDAQKKLCEFIQKILVSSSSVIHSTSSGTENMNDCCITPHFSLFMRTVIQQSPGSLSLLDLTILEQYVLQGIMHAMDDEKKSAAIFLYQSVKKLQGLDA